MRILKYIILILLIILGVSFASLNADTVKINYYIASSELPLSLLLTISLGIGILIGLVSSSFSILCLKRQKHQLQGRIKIADKEIENLRAIPLKDEH